MADDKASEQVFEFNVTDDEGNIISEQEFRDQNPDLFKDEKDKGEAEAEEKDEFALDFDTGPLAAMPTLREMIENWDKEEQTARIAELSEKEDEEQDRRIAEGKESPLPFQQREIVETPTFENGPIKDTPATKPFEFIRSPNPIFDFQEGPTTSEEKPEIEKRAFSEGPVLLGTNVETQLEEILEDIKDEDVEVEEPKIITPSVTGTGSQPFKFREEAKRQLDISMDKAEAEAKVKIPVDKRISQFTELVEEDEISQLVGPSGQAIKISSIPTIISNEPAASGIRNLSKRIRERTSSIRTALTPRLETALTTGKFIATETGKELNRKFIEKKEQTGRILRSRPVRLGSAIARAGERKIISGVSRLEGRFLVPEESRRPLIEFGRRLTSREKELREITSGIGTQEQRRLREIQLGDIEKEIAQRDTRIGEIDGILSRSGNVDPPLSVFEFERLKRERARILEALDTFAKRETLLSISPVVSETVRGGAFTELRAISSLEDRRRRERLASARQRIKGVFRRDLPGVSRVSRQFFTPGLENTEQLFGGPITSGTRRKIGRPRTQNIKRLRELQGAGVSTQIEVSPSQQARAETPRRRVALRGVQREVDKQTGEVDFLIGTEFGVIRVPGHQLLS